MSSPSIALFENLMSPKKEIRETAEKDLDHLKTLPVAEALKVFNEAMSSPNESIFQLATLMLKKIFLDNKEKKDTLTPNDLNDLVALLKSKLNFSSSWKSIQRIADALSPCYLALSLPNGLNEIMNWFNDANNATSRKFAIYLIEVLCDLEAIKDSMLDQTACDNFKEIFNKGLSDVDIDVKVSSLKATTMFLNSLQSEELIMKFTSLTDKMIATLIDALKHDNETKDTKASGKTALETLNVILDSHPKFWKGKSDMIIDIVCQIVKGKTFTNSIREIALELVYSLAKNVPGAVKKSNNFKNIFIPLMFELLLEVDNIDNIPAWEKQVEEDEVDLDDIFYGVRDGFERLSIDLGGKFFMEATSGFINKYLTSQNWVEIHAAFTALAFISEGCKEQYKSHLLEILGFVSNGLTNQHPRVRYAALSAFGLILKETAPKPQKEYTNNILPALATLMGDKETSIRVKTNSCNCIVEYLRGLLNEEEKNDDAVKVLSPYSSDLIKLLSGLFEHSLKINYAPLQEATLTSISLMSNLLEKDFAPYYDMIMPGLKKLFYNFEAKTTEQKTLKSNCIETIAFLCSSVSENSEKYMGDLTEISQAFANYMNTLAEEDPQLGTLLTAFSHLSLSMKEKFIPILNSLLPMLTKYIKADIGVKIEDAQLTEYIPEDEESTEGKVDSVVLAMGTKSAKLSLHTFALQNKILAFHSLNEIAANMTKAFLPYTETLLQLAKELMQFPYSRKIRKLCIKAVSNCITCCTTEEEKGKIMTFIGEQIVNGFTHNIKSRYLKEVKSYLKYLTLITANVNDGKTFTEAFVSKIYECMSEVVKFIDTQKANILTKVLNAKDEDEDEELLGEDFDTLSEVSRRVMELSGNFFKIYHESLTALVTKSLYDSFLSNWQSDLNRQKFNSSQEVLSAICFFCDYMEHSDLVAFNMFNPIFVDMTYNYKTDNEDIIQSIVYGYGVICQKSTVNDFLKVKEKVATVLVNVIQRPLTEENEIAYDNAVGAMGKLVYYQLTDDETGLNMSGTFMKMLPLKHDLEEGKAVCKELFSQINKGNKMVMNEKVFPLMKEAIKRIKEFNDDNKFLEEVEVTLREICGKLGM